MNILVWPKLCPKQIKNFFSYSYQESAYLSAFKASNAINWPGDPAKFWFSFKKLILHRLFLLAYKESEIS